MQRAEGLSLLISGQLPSITTFFKEMPDANFHYTARQEGASGFNELWECPHPKDPLCVMMMVMVMEAVVVATEMTLVTAMVVTVAMIVMVTVVIVVVVINGGNDGSRGDDGDNGNYDDRMMEVVVNGITMGGGDDHGGS